MDELIGQQLGTYTIERLLGRGGMAAVFLAHDANMDRQVAVKVLPREFSYDQVYVERFKREVKTIAKLAHPNIVPVHAFGEQDGWTYIVMTYLPGGTLHARIKQKGSSIPLETIVSYMDQIASAVDYAHSSGIIHRDFKPANVLIGERSHLALSDFGIARMAEGTSQLTGTAMLGTPAYMAPEMANEGGLTKLVDVYSVGATLYELLTGRVPFNADTPMGMLLAHVSSPVPDARERRDNLPDSVQAVIEQAMAKDPTQRSQSAGEIAAGLRDALGMPQAVDGAAELLDDDGSTIATPRPRTPLQPTKARPLTGGARTVASARPKLPVALIGGAAAVLAVVVVAVLALSGAFSSLAGSLTPTDDQPTEVVEAAPMVVSLQPSARVVLGSGDFRTSDSGDFQPLAGSEPMAVGAAIRMGNDGVAVLTFAPGVSVEVQPGAVVSIDRIEIVGDTLFVELTQESGTTYHFVGADAGGLKRDYAVHTPHGTIKAVGTEFWVNEAPEGWYYIPAEGTTTFAHNDSLAPGDQYVEHASTGDCLLVDLSSNVTNCTNLPRLVLNTDGVGINVTPTADVVFNPPSATACSESWHCSEDPDQKGVLIHVRNDCSIELLPGNPDCAYQMGGGRPTAEPGCIPGNCGDGGVFCWQSALCNANYDVVWTCEKYDACNVPCGTCSACGSQCTP